jgi:hypothetical protein
MTSQDNTDLADFSLVRWRCGSQGDFTGGLVHAGQLWSLTGVPDIEGVPDLLHPRRTAAQPPQKACPIHTRSAAHV